MTKSVFLLLLLFLELTTEDRRRNGRKGAYIRLANSADWTDVTAPARAAGPNSVEWHERRIDPDNQLPPEQRRKMGEAAREAWYLDLGDKSRQARAARKAKAEGTA
jgi:hypothetical protein